MNEHQALNIIFTVVPYIYPGRSHYDCSGRSNRIQNEYTRTHEKLLFTTSMYRTVININRKNRMLHGCCWFGECAAALIISPQWPQIKKSGEWEYQQVSCPS